MNRQEVKELLELIISLYPNIKLTHEMANVWVECLEGISFDKARSNLIKHVKQSRYAPTIADIRCFERKPKTVFSRYCETTGDEYEIFDRTMN